VLAAVLRRCGADVDLATTAAQGLEKVRNWRPDVILSDVMLPDRDGCSLMRDVRALPDDRGGRTPAMALSVHARPDERQRAIEAGFAIFRQKPIEPADLAFDIVRLARGR
jgi:CheY-like chemotaxis protein